MKTLIGKIHNSQRFDLLKASTSWEGDVKTILAMVEIMSHMCKLNLRRLMSYIYMEHPFLMFLDHTQRRSTVGRTPLDE